MYSTEYKCTKKETVFTTISIVAVKGSKRKPQSKSNKPILNHENNFKKHIEPFKLTS